MSKINKNRIYDNIPELGELIEKVKHLSKSYKKEIFIELKKIIMDYDSELFDKHALDFPMGFKRRWYDNGPHSWLVINSFKYINEELSNIIIDYLKKKLS